MASLEKKEKNQKHILDNLDKYVLDSRGNFYSKYFEDNNKELFFVGKEAVSNFDEIADAMVSMILQNKEDWEAVLENGYYIKSKRDERIFNENGFGHKYTHEGFFINRRYNLFGELGYREGVWKNYQEIRKQHEEWMENQRKWIKERAEQSQQNPNQSPSENTLPTQPQEPKNPDNQNQNTPPPNQEQQKPANSNSENKNNENISNEPTNQDNSSPSSNQENNSPPLSPTDIQNNYNSDKVKSEIDNNSNLTNNPEQKNQAQELLKLIITAELLTKKDQFDQKILSRLIKEKEQNTSLYQLLNKEERINKVINQLESIQKKNNDKLVANNKSKQDKNSLPTEIIVFVGIFLVVIVGFGIMIWLRKKKLKNK